ncbi:unnamed protein product [Closterium sp. NIES-64]|nr:unnamed protein product [Closterium sp. NIES-64]
MGRVGRVAAGGALAGQGTRQRATRGQGRALSGGRLTGKAGRAAASGARVGQRARWQSAREQSGAARRRAARGQGARHGGERRAGRAEQGAQAEQGATARTRAAAPQSSAVTATLTSTDRRVTCSPQCSLQLSSPSPIIFVSALAAVLAVTLVTPAVTS